MNNDHEIGTQEGVQKGSWQAYYYAAQVFVGLTVLVMVWGLFQLYYVNWPLLGYLLSGIAVMISAHYLHQARSTFKATGLLCTHALVSCGALTIIYAMFSGAHWKWFDGSRKILPRPGIHAANGTVKLVTKAYLVIGSSLKPAEDLQALSRGGSKYLSV